jgi:hypothetical protein
LITQNVDSRFYEVQRFLVSQAKGVINKDQTLAAYENRNTVSAKNCLFLPDAPFQGNIAHLGLINRPACVRPRVAFVGNFVSENEYGGREGEGQLRICKALSSQEIYYHMFPIDYGHRRPEILKSYDDLASSSEYFILNDHLTSTRLLSELKRMDFGSYLMPLFHDDRLLSRSFIKYPELGVDGLPTRFADYLNAGLPLIVSHGLNAVRALIDAHEIGLVISKNDLMVVRERIDEYCYLRLRRNVVDFVRDYFNLKLFSQPLLEFVLS